jgi:tRNA-(ms[2]io[6]A)-hydroxylase
MTDLQNIHDFLHCETPDQWITTALENQTTLLIDHANCEKKAASTAMNLIYRCIDKHDLLNKLSKLAREELRHFEQVIALMKKRGIEYVPISSSRYAGELRKLVRTYEPARLTDILIIGAFIEARSCERFAKLAPFLDDELRTFYESLLTSESRHFKDYLKLAEKYSDEPINERIELIGQKEKELIESPDTEFRFHSGPIAA